MPWREICPMELRMRLVNALVAEDRMTALCEEYGVSRKTGYKWLTRYLAEGADRADRTRAGTACGAVGSHPGAERGDHRHAAAASELATEKTARQVAGASAATALAGAEHHR
jgi:hypothetical protein